MLRLSAVERGLVIGLFALWALIFALAIQAQIQNVGILSFYVEPARDGGYPRFVAFRPPVTAGRSGLEPGDVLLRLGDRDLRGIGRAELFALTADQARGKRELPIAYARAGVRHEALVPLESHRIFWPMLPLSAALALGAAFISLRIRPTRLTRIGCLAFLVGAIETTAIAHTSSSVVAWVVPVRVIAVGLSGPLILMAAQRFPSGREPLGAMRWLPWIMVVRAPVVVSIYYGAPLPPAIAMTAIVVLGCAFLAAGSAILVANYRRADAIARRQMRWVVAGVLVASLPNMVSFPIAAWNPAHIRWAFATTSAYAIVPVCVLIAISRYNLFDVDRLVTAAISYNALLFALVGGVLLLVPGAAGAASDALGGDPATVQAILSFALFAALLPAQRRLRGGIERLFFKESVEVERVVAELMRGLSACPDARSLLLRLGAGLDAAWRPAACAVYAWDGETFRPVHASGRALPPAFDAGGPLFSTLSSRREPLAFGDSRGGGAQLPMDPFERATLEALGVEAVQPVHAGVELVAVLCLGEKGSGDVYTRTDLSWLRALGDRATAELERFDRERVLAETRALQQQLRRYVPGAVAAEIEQGRTLEAGEREVSVLFVDIRGYTSFSEDREAEVVFQTINRYTETVSRIVREHGGSVVEFNGDGMMAVFGAPQALPNKERVAVAAARRLVREIPQLPADGHPGGLAVCVGIATGPAFVGDIRAADRSIWSAIGNTTNLAARLQALTKELSADVLVDEPTASRLGADAAELRRVEGVSIRGRTEPLVVFAL